MASTTELLSRGVAAMNALATVFLVVGFLRIRRGDRAGHGKAMATAFVTSALFLALYLASRSTSGSPWARPTSSTAPRSA